MTWWPWQTKQIPTVTSNSSGRSPGACEVCNGYGMICLNGHTFLCWEHYCDEMRWQREALRVHAVSQEKD